MEKKKFILPLVNAHTHAAMVGFRGIAEDIPLNEWLNKFIWPMERKKISPKFVYEQTKLAVREMKKNGIKIFSDMYFFEDEVARVAEELKMKVVVGEVILDFPTPSAKSPNEALRITERLIQKYKDNEFVEVAVAPHSIYATSERILIEAKKISKKYGKIFHIHAAETKKEFDECVRKNNLTPIAYLEKIGVLDEKTVLVHCVWITDEDIKIIARRKSSVAHCPMSNLKLGSGIAPIAKMMEGGINVCLGTDGAASSNRLDIWEAGKIAALLQKGINNNPAKIKSKEAIEMMTLNGMKALEIKKIGKKKISEIKKDFSREKDYNFLYHLDINNLDFS